MHILSCLESALKSVEDMGVSKAQTARPVLLSGRPVSYADERRMIQLLADLDTTAVERMQ